MTDHLSFNANLGLDFTTHRSRSTTPLITCLLMHLQLSTHFMHIFSKTLSYQILSLLIPPLSLCSIFTHKDFPHRTVPVFFPPPSVRYYRVYLCCWIGRLSQEKAALNAAPLSLLTHCLSLRARLRGKRSPRSLLLLLHQAESILAAW